MRDAVLTLAPVEGYPHLFAAHIGHQSTGMMLERMHRRNGETVYQVREERDLGWFLDPIEAVRAAIVHRFDLD